MNPISSFAQLHPNKCAEDTFSVSTSSSDHNSSSLQKPNLSIFKKLQTRSARKEIRSLVAHKIIMSMVDKYEHDKNLDLASISHELSVKQTNKTLQSYVIYRVDKQSKRIKEFVDSTDPNLPEFIKKPIVLPAAKAGTQYDLVVARQVIDDSKVTFYEKPSHLSQEEQLELEAQGIFLRRSNESSDSVYLGSGSFGEVSLVKQVTAEGRVGRWQAMKVCNNRLCHLNSEIDINNYLLNQANESVDANTPFISPNAYIPPYLTTDKKRSHDAVFFSDVGNRAYLNFQYRFNTPTERKEMLVSLAHSLHTINEYGVTHRDIKPDNVLMKNDKPVLIDFGLSEVAESIDTWSGSPNYMAPEILKHKGGLNRPTDIYSMGLLFAHTVGLKQLITLKRGDGRDTGSKEGRMKLLLEQRDDFIEKVHGHPKSQPLGQLIADMICPDPDRRPTINEVVNTLNDMHSRNFIKFNDA